MYVAEFWESCGSLSQAAAMNQGCDAAIRKFLCCNNTDDGVDVFVCKLREMSITELSLAQFCDHVQVMLKFIFLHV